MTEYDIETEPVHAPLELIDAGAMADACEVPWWNRTLCQVNDSLARLGVFQGEFHWHHHDREDELFFVLEGTFFLDVDRDGVEETHALGPLQGMVVPKGVRHRTRSPERSVVLMVEATSVTPTGDAEA